MNIPERTKKSVAGLKKMVNYIFHEMLIDKEYYKNYPRRIAEIGVWTGAGTQVFAYHFSEVYAIDPWAPGLEIAGEYDMREVEAIFDKRFTFNNNQDAAISLQVSRVHKMKMTSVEAAHSFEAGFFDVVYIDAIHAYEGVKEDIHVWFPKVRSGGYLCGHDYCRKFPGVVRAVDELRGGRHKTFPDTSWAVKIC